jgi:hypothetical protein
LLLIILLVLSSSAQGNEQATKSIPASAQTVAYIWQKGDSLSKVLYEKGIGRFANGARLYGRRGWIALNIEFSRRKNWDDIASGTEITLLIPRDKDAAALAETAMARASAPQDSVVGEAAASQQKAVSTATTESDEALVAATAATSPAAAVAVEESSPEEAAVLSDGSAPSEEPASKEIQPPQKKSKSKSKSISKIKFRDVMVFTSIAFLLGLAFLLRRYHVAREQSRKLRIIAKGYLSWLSLNSPHQAEQVALAESLFVKAKDDRSLHAYEVMGFLGRDMEQLKALTVYMRENSAYPNVVYPLDPLQHEVMEKFVLTSPEVLFHIIAAARSPYLQLATVHVFHRFLRDWPDRSHYPQLREKLAVFASDSLFLTAEDALKSEILRIFALLEDTRGTSKSA